MDLIVPIFSKKKKPKNKKLGVAVATLNGRIGRVKSPPKGLEPPHGLWGWLDVATWGGLPQMAKGVTTVTPKFLFIYFLI
jgi:hypothetical protein